MTLPFFQFRMGMCGVVYMEYKNLWILLVKRIKKLVVMDGIKSMKNVTKCIEDVWEVF